MPDCPFLSARNASSCFDQWVLCATPRRRFGRSKPWTMTRLVALEQLLRDVRARRLVGGRGEGGDVRRREQFLQPGQLLIFRPEARPPFGDAMRLVHHEQVGVEPVQRAQHVLVHQPLGREIEQLGLARRRLAPFRDLLVPPHAGMDRGRLDAIGAQAGDLIVHQRLQRRNDDGRPLQQQCRDLVAQRLARPGRHHRQHVLAAEDEIDDLLLPGAEGECSRRRRGGFGRGWSCAQTSRRLARGHHAHQTCHPGRAQRDPEPMPTIRANGDAA